MIMELIVAAAFAQAAPASAAAEPPPAAAPAVQDAHEILERAVAAAGGEVWLNPRTLVMRGRATFYRDGPEPRSIADDYRMWRVFDPDRQAAHVAEGMVRIRALGGGRVLFEAGYDGEVTWNERGIVPPAEADAYWASNFGFGIIRHAFDPGFRLERVPDGNVEGHGVFKLKLTDPGGQVTLFGIDRETYWIRSMEFATPRGWHMRIYDDFVELASPRWLQARRVTLYYNGLKQNEVEWQEVRVNGALDRALFSYPPRPVP